MNCILPIFFFFVLLITSCTKKSENRFNLLDASKTGIDFNNEIVESDSLNIIIHNYIYNGGGIGVADFNNDGYEDLFFAGNLVDNKFYLNKGDMTFEEVTKISKTEGKEKWCSGVNIIDMNKDQKPDIYITATYHENPELRKNILYINTGNDQNGIPIFENQAEKYNLDDEGYSTHSFAFDYDKDGDLDIYLLNNKLNISKTSALNRKLRRGDSPSNDKLLRNDNGTFTDVTVEANILDWGFGLGIALLDINKDTWPDLYISNDFVTNDLLYVNQRDGTFKNEIDKYLNHQSFSSMGNDIADINNDGLEEIFTLDMLPRKDARMKMMFGGMNHYYYDIMLAKGYELEYARNVFQLNRGNGYFSDIGMISDLHNTDWSWSILMQDYTNDGQKDMFISNGFPRDITDLDFSDYHSGINVMFSVTDKLLSTIPRVKIPNLFIENKGELKFEDVTEKWVKSPPSYSNGAAYADLDNDGDLDLICSNINDPAFIYENISKRNSNYIQISLIGNNQVSPIGASIECISNNGSKQYQIFQPNRGYCSTSQAIAHFGLGNDSISQIIVTWPDSNVQTFNAPSINQKLAITYERQRKWTPTVFENPIFEKLEIAGISDYKHSEKRFYDFDVQNLMQSLDSEKGPALAIGDLDNNNTDDIVIGGNMHFPLTIIYQELNGSFTRKEWKNTHSDVAGILTHDFNNDGLTDIFFTQGSSETSDYVKLRNRLLINTGDRNFEEDRSIIQAENDYGHSSISAADFDKDGDLDIFVGGHSIPSRFPLSAKPQLLINENGVFTDRFDDYFDLDEDYFLINSAIWTDVNNDNWVDLISVGKWTPVNIHFSNEGKSFESKAISSSSGLWTSIIGSDLDNDGDTDYVLGNQGLNNKYQIDDNHPIFLYAKDFDTNGSIDLILSHFIDGEYKPYHLRNDMTKQLKSLSKVFENYISYSTANTEAVLATLDTTGMKTFQVDHLDHIVLYNLDGLDFEIKSLPYQTQFSCMHGILIKDINQDGFQDIISVGNDYGTEVFTGRTDAGIGNITLNFGDSLAHFNPIESNFYVPGNTRGIVSFKDHVNDDQLFIIPRNNDSPILYTDTLDQASILLPELTFKIIVEEKEGRQSVQEIYNGGSYLSQNSRYYFFDPQNVKSIKAITYLGEENETYNSENL